MGGLNERSLYYFYIRIIYRLTTCFLLFHKTRKNLFLLLFSLTICTPKDEGEIYVTKNCVTLHNYSDPQNPVYRGVQKNQEVKVLDQETKWWKVKHGKFIGYASRYYFAPKNVKNSYESEE